MTSNYSNSNPAKIMVVDDHPIVREGISLLISRENDLHVCCETGSAEKVLEKNTACPHDLIILDLSLGEFYGYDLIKVLRCECPQSLILVLSMHEETVYAERVLKAGAQGYVMKQAAVGTLLHAIRDVLDGEFYISNRMRTRMISQFVDDTNKATPFNGLSATELQILQMIGKGLGNAEIASIFNRSVKTIETHRTNMRRKLKIYSGRDLTKYAIQWLEKQ
ncbi:MAG: response regulator transcription factor [Methylococcales bacterium]